MMLPSNSTEGQLPVVRPLPSELTPVDVFESLQHLPHVVFFDSAMPHDKLGRYSFVAADPFEWIELPADGADALGHLSERLSAFCAETIAELPPFQGGAAGLLGYELCYSLEQLPRPKFNEFALPALAMGLYDVVVAFDHLAGKAWVISQGFPEQDSAARYRRAEKRADELLAWLTRPPNEPTAPPPALPCPPLTSPPLGLSELAPQFPSEVLPNLTSDFSPEGYLKAVARAVEYVHAGDLFQVNLSQRLLYPAEGSSVDLYLRLRQRNPAPFAGYFDLGTYQIATASPERFLRVTGDKVETRPIKGTRPRTTLPEADLFSGSELSQSVKDRSENIMIVDLLRNDLSRVCLPESLKVTQLCGLESYAYVQHLVSVVEGRLREGRSAIDLLRATFPGGSITGAPKVRAMQMIAELEPTARGAYCGSLAYLGFDGALDSNLLIRTLTAGRGWWQLPVGGGIVADSDPQNEYEETWHKAAGLLHALQG